MTESKPRKNNDYTASAVNLTNHEVYKGMFENGVHAARDITVCVYWNKETAAGYILIDISYVVSVNPEGVCPGANAELGTGNQRKSKY